MTTTPEHAGAVERLTAYAEWLRNSEPNSPYDSSGVAKDEDIFAVLAALTVSEARVLELVGAVGKADSELSFIQGAVAGLRRDFDEFDKASKKLGSNASRHLTSIRQRVFEGIEACARDARSALNATSPGMGEVKE
jgi:hypothetical protein